MTALQLKDDRSGGGGIQNIELTWKCALSAGYVFAACSPSIHGPSSDETHRFIALCDIPVPAYDL